MRRASPARLEPGDDLRHGRRPHLLGAGQVGEPLRTAEHQHRERRQARRADAGLLVLLAHPAQQVDGGRVQRVGDGEAAFST